MRTRTKWVWGLGGTVSIASLAVVALHLAPVRGALGMKPLGTGAPSAFCPLGYGKQAATTASLGPVKPRPASSTPRPALGFVLDVTGPADVTKWATEHGIHCTSRYGGAVVECANVPPSLVSGGLAATTVWFRFKDRALTAIQTVRRSPEAAPVATAFMAESAAIRAAVGAPTKADGSAAVADLSRDLLRQAMVEYRLPGYRAVLRATNMGDGYVLTETYAADL